MSKRYRMTVLFFGMDKMSPCRRIRIPKESHSTRAESSVQICEYASLDCAETTTTVKAVGVTAFNKIPVLLKVCGYVLDQTGGISKASESF